MQCSNASRAHRQHEPGSRVRDYVFLKELGRGGFGIVYQASKEQVEENVAIKAVQMLNPLQSEEKRQQHIKLLRREISILEKLPQHENILELIETFEEDGYWYLVLELVSGGNLCDVMLCRVERRFHQREAAFIFRQLVNGLGFLHDNDVIHRDLKLENVLVTAENKEANLSFLKVKIADFGLSKEVGDGFSLAISRVGTQSYAAPEVYKKRPYTKQVDLWSLGALLYTLLAGKLWDSSCKKPVEQLAALQEQEAAHSVLTGLLQVEPSLRTSLEALKSCAWLNGDHQAEASLPCLSVRTPSYSPSSEQLLGSAPLDQAPHTSKTPGENGPASPPAASGCGTGRRSRDQCVPQKASRGGSLWPPRMRPRSRSGGAEPDDLLLAKPSQSPRLAVEAATGSQSPQPRPELSRADVKNRKKTRRGKRGGQQVRCKFEKHVWYGQRKTC